MIFSKYLILSFTLLTSFTFSAEKEYGHKERTARLITQDCRETSLTHADARSLAYRRAGNASSKFAKFVEITEAGILDPFNMPETVLKSIAKGANINTSDKNGCTLLHLACAAQNINLALEFIKCGALLLPNSQNVYPQHLISPDILNINDIEADCLRNLLIEEQMRYVSEYKQMGTRKTS